MKYLNTVVLLFTFSMVYGQTFVKDFFSINEFVTIGNQSFFVAIDGVHGSELWKTDGTKENSVLIKDINTLGNGSPEHLVVFNNEVYFSANDGVFGQELWKTDGSESGTVLVKNIHQSFGQGSYPSNFTVFNNELYFTATDNFINGNYQLWKTDGTNDGTLKVYDAGGVRINELLVANNKLYLKQGGLAEYDTISNSLIPITVDSEYPVIGELNSFDNGLYFITSINYSRQDIRFYRLEEEGNIILLQEFTQPQYGDIDIHNFTQIGNEVYFSITTDFDSGNDTDVLWKTDGTNLGTLPITSFDWDRHLSESNISNFIEYNDELFFNSGSQNNYVLWKSDGTEAGTAQASNISVDRSVDFVTLNNLLYFSNNQKLWSTDGTDANTTKFSDLIIPSQVSDDFFNVKAANSTIFFESVYQNRRALYTTELNPIIEVKKGYSIIETNNVASFESKIDSVVRNIIKVKNVGNKELIFSKVKVVGQDFYIDGQLSSNITEQNPDGNFLQILEPGAQSEFELSFYPSTKGLKKATLSILSNDINTPNFNIELIGFAEDEIGLNINESISLDKEINFSSPDLLINIDNNTIQENTPINSLVGILNIPNSNESFSYELISDGGNLDIQYFSIENNDLITDTIFNFEQKNTYAIRVKATNNTTNEIIEENIIISILDVVEDPVLGDCSLDVKNLAFGLNDVEFIDNQNVVAVGGHGVILKSNDGGDTWRKIRSDIYNHLSNIQFTTNTIGYAIGKKILKTEDAGESWYTLKLPDEPYPFPSNLFFINSDVGFVFGNDGKIFKTTDGGRYWKLKDLGSSNFNSVYFLNESKGFIVGRSETLMKTIDGGDNWENVDLGIGGLRYNISLTNIYFVNDLIGFISGDYGEIIKTTDGGNTWALASELEYDININDLFFQDENIGYALTEGYLYKTIDGGGTWNAENIEYYYSGLKGISFSNDGNKSCLVGHGTSCCTGYNTGHIIHTKELDNDWKTLSYLSLRSYPLTAVHFEENNGFVFGNDIAGKTLDGGVTWKEITPPEANIYQVEVFNDNVYLLGQNNFYKSTDSGETWATLSTSNNFRKLFFINEQTIFAASYGLGVFKTIDGGLNWVNVSTQPAYGLNLYFLNENEGYVGAVNDGMFKTLDGGNTWTQVTLEPVGGYLNIYSINFFNNIGFTGSTAGLLKTIDGGDTWVRTNKNLGGNVKFIHPISELEWYVVSGGRLFKTNDGGENWTSEYYDEEVIDAHFTEDKAYLVGYRSFIEIGVKKPPSVPSHIQGDLYVGLQTLEEYSVVNDFDTNYIWSVSGDNEINYSGNKATISWNTPGTYQLMVTPYNDCGNGSAREITVIVEESNISPVIEGDEEVEEFSIHNEYFTSINAYSRYNWFVNGHQNFSANNNIITIDWGESGLGKIKLIETNVNSGTRKEAFLNVNINPVPIPSDNFNIEVISETCPNKNNGKIIISANETYNYVAIINGVEYNFTNDLTIEDLAPDIYELCITIPPGSYEQCYFIELPEGVSISGRSSEESGRVSINIDKGTAPYKVLVNGKLVLQTFSTSFSIDVQHGDSVEVKTDKACEGSFSKMIDLVDEVIAYPNPTTGDFEIAIPINLENITIDLYTIHSQLISSTSYPVVNGKIQLSLKEKPTGLYLIRIYLDNPVMLKLIKN